MRERFLVEYLVYAFAACVLAASLCACGGQAQGTSNAGAAASEEAAAGASADAGAGADAASNADDSSSAGGASEPASQASATKRRIIIDTDTGADDASAIILAAEDKDVEILGVTVLLGNVDLDQATKNVLMALEMADCDAPVYRGSAETYNGETKETFSVFGTDGMGDADLIHPTRETETGDAIDFILDTVRQNPGEVEIVALGPATNIAKAIERDPETMQKTKRIWSMGTAGMGHGNATPVAEFNVYADAEAYKVMLDSGIPITVVGLDMCGEDACWTDAQFEELKGVGETGEFVASSFTKIREFYKANGFGDRVYNCDALAMMCVLYPDFVNESISTHASCVTDPGETFAQVVFYKEGFTYDGAEVSNDLDYNVDLVQDVDKADYFARYKEAIS